MSKNQLLGGGHLLETSSRGASKFWQNRPRRRTVTPSLNRLITGTLGASTVLLFIAFLFPSLPTPVSAEEEGTTATLALDSTVSITIPSTIEMDVAPTTSGTFTSTTSTLSITTNNPSGYDLYLSAADGDNVLRNENPSVQNTINPTTDGVTSTTMSNNTWGYNLSGGSSTQTSDTYNAVPKDGTTALDSTTAPSTTNYNLTFGAKVDTNIASGTYSSEVHPSCCRRTS